MMNNEIFWRAINEKDARFNGVFFTTVLTTKIYCKPSCAARVPKRENVQFVATCEEAEKQGFRACLRCKPKEFDAPNANLELVRNACKYIEANDFEQPSLDDLSAETGFSTTHLQKVFKQILGVSPKEFADKLRLEKFKESVKKGSDVTNAMYDAGFGSSRALYEKSAQNLGMTPLVYKKGGLNMRIAFTIADCKLGKMLVGATEKGICSVTFGDEAEFLTTKLHEEFPNAEIIENDANLKEFVEAILKNLDGKQPILDLPLDMQATAFQMRVWSELRKIPFGETLSYKQVAEKIGDPKAVRAVARACARNRVALVIPCHRVIGTNGKMSGYRWGIERKERLLNDEKHAAKGER